MAGATSLSLCNVLCFLVNKAGSTPVKMIKSALIDFYNAEDLSAAKKILMDDIAMLKISVKFPHIGLPQRRDGDNKLSREVDDIFALYMCLDENKLLEQLPT